MIQVALVGYGYWGPNLARCIASNPQAALAGICETIPARRELARAAYPGIPVHGAVEVLLQDPAIGALVIATPPGSHATLARSALEHRKHLLVEKPLALSSAEAVGLREAAGREARVLMVDHTYLYSPAFRAIQRLIVERNLGPLRYYHSTRANCFAPDCETSVVWDLAVHDLSILDQLMDASPESVQVTGLGAAPGGPESHAQLTLAYPGHALAGVLVSWIAPAKERTIHLGFDCHTIVWDELLNDQALRLFDRGREPVVDPANHRQPNTAVEAIPVPAGEPLANAIEHFLTCIELGREPLSGAASAIRTVRILEAAERSLGSGGSPETLPVSVAAA